MATLKPFYVNLNDLAFLLSQVNFVPLFDGVANSNGIVNFDPLAMDAWDARGNKVWDHATSTGSYQGVALTSANVALLGRGFPQVSTPVGIRDVTGLHNNLFGTQADWGTVDVEFRRDIAADFSSYVASPGADYTPGTGTNIIDYMPRIISRTITIGGVNLLTDASGHYVGWDSARYGSDQAYKSLIDGSGVVTANLVEGAKIVAPVNTQIAVLDGNGAPLIFTAAQYQASIVYTTALAVFAATSYGGLTDSTGGTLQAGEAIYYRPTPGGALVNLNQTYQPDVLAYKQLIDANVNFSAGAPADNTAVVTTISESGYGLLETLGHVDFQNPTSGEFFIGSENPGVAPVNSWFAIFGQFFDHGLDLIGKGGPGAGKITIALETTDPLYGTIGADGTPVTSITISRATIAGQDANGDPNYVNHTSPFIDQSQTYGSSDQITQLLRKWVSTDSGATYHAGLEMFDGQTLADTWTRRWPDGTTSEVRDTLPTLSELRDHVLDTKRAGLTWEDVSNYRTRSADGQIGTGASGHALILDMNPRFDSAHLDSLQAVGNTTVDALVDAAVATLDASLAGGRHFARSASGGIELTGLGPNPISGAGALIAAGWVNPTDFSITLPAGQLHDAVGEILLAAVGDHYVAGDGRVNENFGLTSIHHVFHEEHNYQVENLKSWIYQHDTHNPGATDAHEKLHDWQVNNHLASNNTDANGNFLNADGSIAWDADKMFNATKLIVEMEYQHAAVDQYARTVTPRIQEFVGYSTGVDPTVSLEYSQVAFRFGHSTIRETLETLDPNGWMLGNVTRYALEKAFLAPQSFAQEGAAAITLGLSRQQMSEVDEFITPALNQGLLGQPLDLAAINIARGRDLGIPTLNDFREGISLARYTSWADFGANMIHPESLVNFIAAYSFNGDVALATVAMQNAAFMNNTADGALGVPTGADGFNHIDSWIGGLAEAHVPGGLLGETFDAVFVAQIQSLMDGDRFYYLYRLFGTNIHEEVNNGQFKDIVERNTGLSHLNGSIFAYADKYYDFGREADGTEHLASETTPATGDHGNHLYADLLDAAGNTKGIHSDGGASVALNGANISVTAADFVRAPVSLNLIRDVRPELDPTQVHPVEGTPTSGADSHEVIVATKFADYIHARGGDDTVYGEDGDDFIFGDGGVDRLYGGSGNDMIDTGEGPDLADGGAGKDIIYGRGSGSEVGGFDQLVGGSGNDLIIGGEGIDKLSGGSGDDIIYGDGLTNPEMGNTDPFTHGGDGNDYIDGGASGDLIYGEEGDDYIVGGIDQDLIQGGDGDDVLRPGSPSQAIGGGPDEVIGGDGATDTGFDLIDFSDYAGSAPGIVADMDTQFNPLIAIDGTVPFPAWTQMEGVIGTKNNDTLSGTDGLNPAGDANLFGGGNWLIGGSGSDTLAGRGGNDLLVGGSIRLDTLIGKYADAANVSGPGNLKVGSTEWLADSMRTGSTGFTGANDGYDNDTENGYSGASNQATGTLSQGLLGAAGFDKHFTDMLKSRMFKDVELGDGGADAASTDTAVFSGNFADYTMIALDVNGAVVADPHANWNNVFAIKITDTVATRTLEDGTEVPGDGTDLVVGVELLKFADQTVKAGAYFDAAPVLDLYYVPVPSTAQVAADNFGGAPNNNAYARGTGAWVTNWTEVNDGANAANNGQIQVTGGNPALRLGAGDGAEIVRTLNLSGNTSATVSYSVNEQNFAAGETVTVLFAADGTNFVQQSVITSTMNNPGNQSLTVSAPTLGFAMNAALKFVVSNVAVATNAHTVTIDNITVTAPRQTTDGSPGINATASYTEQLAPAAITITPRITDADDTVLESAKVVLRDPVAGDKLTAGTMPAGITATTSSDGLTVTLTGTAAHALYQDALKMITFSNPTNDDPTTAARHIDVTVNDGLRDSAVATTIVTVTPVNDPTIVGADNIFTNIAVGTAAANNIAIPDWALLANDVDPDSPLSISAIGGGTDGIATTGSGAGHTNGISAVRDASTGGGTFTYTVNGVTATVTLAAQQTGTTLTGTNGNDILIGNDATLTMNGGAGNDIIFGNGGNDTLRGDAGNDTISYTVTTQGNNITSGRDFVDGGTTALDANGRDTGSDTFVLNGATGNETFKILTRAAALAAGVTGLSASTEIVITRQTGNAVAVSSFANLQVLAELDNIEEIRVNTLAVTANDNNGGLDGGAAGGGDTVQIIGAFGTATNATTSLNFNTITINGGSNDRVDITELTSDHRIVFNGATSTSQVIGNLRPQDVVHVSSGPGTPGSGSGSDNGSDGHGTGGNTGGHNGNGADDDTDHHTNGGTDSGTDPGTGGATGTGNVSSNVLFATGSHILQGTAGVDRILGGVERELVIGEDGNDQIFADGGDDVADGGKGDDLIDGGTGKDYLFGGDGKDVIRGDAGDDIIAGDGGDDHLWGGAGNDVVDGGAGKDVIFATGGDGNDVYLGGADVDTIDFSAIATSVNVDLYNKTANGVDIGVDSINGFENVVGGSGNDTITAGEGANVLIGGGGDDTFVFRTAATANGDRIEHFSAGDRIDLRPILGDHATEIAHDATFTAAGQYKLMTNVDGDTVLEGNTDTNADVDFSLVINGEHIRLV